MYKILFGEIVDDESSVFRDGSIRCSECAVGLILVYNGSSCQKLSSKLGKYSCLDLVVFMKCANIRRINRCCNSLFTASYYKRFNKDEEVRVQ